MIDNKDLHNVVNFYKQRNQAQTNEAFAALNNPEFIAQIDDDSASVERIMPARLRDRLVALAQCEPMLDREVQLVQLAQSPLYSDMTPKGGQRRFDLIYAMGYVQTSNTVLLHFLDTVLCEEASYQLAAIEALIKMGTDDALNILWSRLFYPSTNMLSLDAHSDVVAKTIQLLVEHMDNDPIDFFVNRMLMRTSLHSVIRRCVG